MTKPLHTTEVSDEIFILYKQFATADHTGYYMTHTTDLTRHQDYALQTEEIEFLLSLGFIMSHTQNERLRGYNVSKEQFTCKGNPKTTEDADDYEWSAYFAEILQMTARDEASTAMRLPELDYTYNHQSIVSKNEAVSYA